MHESSKRPSFRLVSDLLQFVGDGRNGMLGYVQSLCQSDSTTQYHLQETEMEVLSMREQLQTLIFSSSEKDRLLHFTRCELQSRVQLNEENHATLVANDVLKDEVRALREENERLLCSFESCMCVLNDRSKEEREEHMKLELKLWVEIETLNESHEKSLQAIGTELKRTKTTLRRREKRLENLVKTPYGYRSVVRDRKDLSKLAPKGGHAKRMMRLARSIIVPATKNKIQASNNTSGSRRRLCGTKDIEVQTGKVLASMLSQTEVNAICKEPKLKGVGVKITNKYLEKIGEIIQSADILETCDRNMISHSGYDAIYKQLKGAAKLVGRRIIIGCLPNPWQVSCARRMLNLKLSKHVEEYYSINETFMVPPSAKFAKKDLVKVTLNEMNSLFCDVEQVQRTMMLLYGLTLEGTYLLNSPGRCLSN